MILNKVTDCYLTRADGERIEIQDDKLYHVVTDLYTGQMLGSVMEKCPMDCCLLNRRTGMGILLENLEDQAIMEDDRELKAWDAIARYMQSLMIQMETALQMYLNTMRQPMIVRLWMTAKSILDLVKKSE